MDQTWTGCTTVNGDPNPWCVTQTDADGYPVGSGDTFSTWGYCRSSCPIDQSLILECGGPLKPEVVQSTALSSFYSASNVLILADMDGGDDNGRANFWLAEGGKTTGQGFTLKVGDDCSRLIAGCQIKNKGRELVSGIWNNWWSTKEFRVSGSMNENGPWETLLEDRLVDTTFYGGNRPASLLNFIFKDPVEIQFLKFDLVSFWGPNGGALQYFAAIPAPSKKHHSVSNALCMHACSYPPKGRQGG